MTTTARGEGLGSEQPSRHPDRPPIYLQPPRDLPLRHSNDVARAAEAATSAAASAAKAWYRSFTSGPFLVVGRKLWLRAGAGRAVVSCGA